ncbi:MAG: hypothetical protein ChlgKO_13260 [Chlamydiales bacterium]
MIPALVGEKGGISFYEHCDENVFGFKDGRFLSVNCSKFVFPFNTSEVEKVKRLLVNNRAGSTIDQVKGEILFRQRSMAGWKELSREKFPSRINFLFLSKKGELCFGVGNKFIIRGNNSEERVIEFDNGEVVKRACETADGEFVILAIKDFKKSRIYYRGNVILEDDNLELQLCAIGENLLYCTSKELAAIDLQTGTFLENKGIDYKPHIFSDGTIFWLKGNTLYQSTFSDGKFQDKQIKQHSVYDYKVLDDERLFLKTSNEKSGEIDVQLFNRVSGSLFSGKRLRRVVNGILQNESWGRESACAISDQLIVHRNLYENDDPIYTYYDFSENSEWDAEITEGIHPVVSRLLSDKSVAYITDTGSSKFHILSKKGKKIFSSNKLTNSLDGCHILELPNGNIAIGYLNYRPRSGVLQVLEPDFSSECLDSEIENGLKALKEMDFYTARKIYRKVKKDCPLSREIGKVFCDSTKELLKKGMLSVRTRRFAKNFLREIRLAEGRQHATRRKYRKRLFVGEGSFHFSEILLNKHRKKHPDLARSIVATELMQQEDFEGCEEEIREFKERVDGLKERGLTVRFGVDATNIHNLFKGKRFQRIHWNSPFGAAKERELFYPVLPKFFRSAAQLQEEGDRIHIALDQPESYSKERQGENPMACAATLSKYRLVRKRKFDVDRYPGIYHQKTGKFEEYASGHTGREFVFEKSSESLQSEEEFEEDLETIVRVYTGPDKSIKDKYKNSELFEKLREEGEELEVKLDKLKKKIGKLEMKEEKSYRVGEYYSSRDYLPNTPFFYECSSDEGSSDYYSSDSDVEMSDD